MKRLILAFGLFFNAAGQLLAATVDLYVDNRLAAAGMGQASGSTTTTLKIADFSLARDLTVAATHADFQYMGLHISGGTNAPAATTPFKITAVDTTDPDHPVLTVDAAFNGVNTPQDDWVYSIVYGCNKLNTGAGQTKGSGTGAPVNEIYYAINSSALSSNDVGHVHIRGNTGTTYSGQYGPASNGDRLFYTAFFGATKSFILEGYETTAIPSDLYASANKTSTYIAASASNPDVSVDVAAGKALYDDTTLTAKFPHLRYTNANNTISIGDPTATAPGIEFRALKITHPSTSGTSAVISLANASVSPNLTINRCIIGSLDAADDNAACISNTTSAFVPTNAVTVSKSAILNRRYGADVITLQTLSLSENYFECYGKNNAGSTVNGIFCVKTNNTTAATYNAAMQPTNQILRFIATDNHFVHTATHSAASTTTSGIQVLKSVEMEVCRIKGNKFDLYSQASGILVSGASSFDIQSNRVNISNATTHGVAIAVGADASVEANPTGDGLLLLASGNTDATSSNVAADGSTPLALPAHTAFKLTGGSATNDAYNGMLVRKSATATGPQWSQVWDYDGSTKIAKCTPQFTNAAVGNERWEVFRPRQQAHGVIAHNLVNSVVSPSTSTHAFGLFQGCDHIDFTNNTAIGYFDNGIVLKGEYNRVNNNRILAGRGAMLIKGGSFNEITHNTFYCVNANGGTGCLDVQDKSNVHNMNSGESPLNASHWSKACGNRVVDNIFIVASTNNTVVINDNSIGAASWAGAASSYPMGQANVFDYNVYYQAHASAAFGSMNGSSIANGATLATLTAAWAAYSTAIQYGATNDANSSVGTIVLSDPTNGDFRVRGGTASGKVGSDGQLLGASRTKYYIIGN